MKLLFTFKTPDVLDCALDDAFDGINDEDETLDGMTREEVKKVLERWIKYGEYVSIRVDLKDGTAEVVPVKQ